LKAKIKKAAGLEERGLSSGSPVEDFRAVVIAAQDILGTSASEEEGGDL
jgi:hypothetical protein